MSPYEGSGCKNKTTRDNDIITSISFASFYLKIIKLCSKPNSNPTYLDSSSLWQLFINIDFVLIQGVFSEKLYGENIMQISNKYFHIEIKHQLFG